MRTIPKYCLVVGIAVASFAAAATIFPGGLAAEPKQTTSVRIPSGGTVQRMNDGRLAIRNGLNISGTYSCRCSGDKGSCSTVQSEGLLTCGKDGDSCSGTCQMKTTTSGGKLMMQ